MGGERDYVVPKGVLKVCEKCGRIENGAMDNSFTMHPHLPLTPRKPLGASAGPMSSPTPSPAAVHRIMSSPDPAFRFVDHFQPRFKIVTNSPNSKKSRRHLFPFLE